MAREMLCYGIKETPPEHTDVNADSGQIRLEAKAKFPGTSQTKPRFSTDVPGIGVSEALLARFG